MKNEPLSAKFCSIVVKCLREREPRQIPRSLFTNRALLSVLHGIERFNEVNRVDHCGMCVFFAAA